jgi:hypothetical protein
LLAEKAANDVGRRAGSSGLENGRFDRLPNRILVLSDRRGLAKVGSRVRIPSPAPIFFTYVSGRTFKPFNESEGSVGDFSCFPTSSAKAREAGGSSKPLNLAGYRPPCAGAAYVPASCRSRRTSTAHMVF